MSHEGEGPRGGGEGVGIMSPNVTQGEGGLKTVGKVSRIIKIAPYPRTRAANTLLLRSLLKCPFMLACLKK
jgi:hypothetical protein